MTREETIIILREKRDECKSFYDLSANPERDYPGATMYLKALDLAIAALHPITREQVEKMRGKWIDARYSSKDVPKCQCSICGKKYIGLETDFCQYCGAPMTDKAVDILWKRLEALHGET